MQSATDQRESMGEPNEPVDDVTSSPRVVSIVGTTSSGKTGLAIALAKALQQQGQRAEIVNADAYQMYRGMDIGTAKATPQ